MKDLSYVDYLEPIKPIVLESMKSLLDFMKTITSEDILCTLWDVDMDGLASGYVNDKSLSKLFPNNKRYNYINETKVHGIKKRFMQFIEKKNINILFIVDAGTNDVEQIKELNDKGVTVVVIDHHKMLIPYQNEKFYLINSSFYVDYENVSGAYIVNETYKYIYNELNMIMPENFDELAVFTLISDVCKRDKFVTNVLLNYLKGNISPSPFITKIKKKYQKNTIKTAISLTASINGILRNYGGKRTKELFLNSEELGLHVYNSDIIKKDNKEITNQLLRRARIFQTNNIILVVLSGLENRNIVERNYLGYIAGTVAKSTGKVCMVVCSKRLNYEEEDGDYIYVMSVRDCMDRDILSIFRENGIEAFGHTPAFGGRLYEDFHGKLSKLDKEIAKIDRDNVYPNLVKCNTLTEGIETIKKDIAKVSVHNALSEHKDKVMIPFTLTGQLIKEGNKLNIYQEGMKLTSFDTQLKIGDKVVCIVEIHEKVEMIVRTL